jgi:hypothetical protein
MRNNKPEVWLTCAVVEIIDELLGVVEVVEVLEGVDEDVRA